MSEKLREAARQALEEWDDLQSFQKPTTLHQRIEALRAALAEPEPVQEPVAWMYTGIKSDSTEHGPHLVWKPAYMDAMSASKGAQATPLYTAPPQSRKQEALASMYIALCDAIGYSARSDELQSPEEWAAHLYAKTLRTPTDDASLFGKLGRVMWEMTTTVHSPGISFSEQLELIPTIWSELAKSHRAQRPSLTDEEIEHLSRTMVGGNKSVQWLARIIERKVRGEKE